MIALNRVLGLILLLLAFAALAWLVFFQGISTSTSSVKDTMDSMLGRFGPTKPSDLRDAINEFNYEFIWDFAQVTRQNPKAWDEKKETMTELRERFVQLSSIDANKKEAEKYINTIDEILAGYEPGLTALNDKKFDLAENEFNKTIEDNKINPGSYDNKLLGFSHARLAQVLGENPGRRSQEDWKKIRDNIDEAIKLVGEAPISEVVNRFFERAKLCTDVKACEDYNKLSSDFQKEKKCTGASVFDESNDFCGVGPCFWNAEQGGCVTCKDNFRNCFDYKASDSCIANSCNFHMKCYWKTDKGCDVCPNEINKRFHMSCGFYEYPDNCKRDACGAEPAALVSCEWVENLVSSDECKRQVQGVSG